jgi:hypothetical protein
MSQDSADLCGTTGANFTFTIGSGNILSAYLEVPGKPLVVLTVSGTEREVTVPSLPAGQSWVRLDLTWAPGDPSATIDVGTVTSGTVNASDPKGIITDNDKLGYAELWGA